MLFFHNTSQVDGEPNADLLGEKGGSGWPYVAILDATGAVLARHDGDRVTSAFRATVQSARNTSARLTELQTKADAGDADAAADLLEMRIDLAHLDAEQAWAQLERLESLERIRYDVLSKRIIKMQVGAIQITASNEITTQIAAGAKFARMIADDRIPEDNDALFFWYFTAVYAESEKDADLYARALEGLKKHENRLGAEQLEQMAATLAKLRGGQG